MKKPIYLDYHATTPVDPRVFDVMKKFFLEDFGNPGSNSHEYGDIAAKAVNDARKEIGIAINSQSQSEIIFVSGATEANNLAIHGTAIKLKEAGKSHIITSSIEHKAVLDVTDELERQGFQVTYVQPNSEGFTDPQEIEKAITPRTGLIAIMHVNNEIGVINDIKRIGEIAEKHSVLFHCDAAQSFGKIPIDVQGMNIHLLSISAHKIYGPKGIGALYIRKKSPKVEIEPLLFGGGQERGLRPGTLATPLIAGLAEASRIAREEMASEGKRLQELRDYLFNGLREKCPDIVLNGSMENRLPNNLNVSFLGVDAETLMINLRGEIAVSNGSACTSDNWTSSHVLAGMGINDERIQSAIRFSLGRFTTLDEIGSTIDKISMVIKKLQKLSCLHNS
jgi:cysteine desulfurase